MVRPSFLFLLLLASMLLVLPAPRAGLASGKARHPAARASEDCASCHTDLKHGGASGRFAPECAACHSDAQPDLLQKAAKANLEMQRQAQAGVPAVGRLGMEGAMYPAQSRLGPAPNAMVLIPAGDFIMGTNDRLPDEGPEHTVTLPAYAIDKYEVTNLQYRQFNDATNRKSPAHFRNRTFPAGKADHPVTFVSWFDAEAYCAWAGKRLPTDAEWEKAARGTDGRSFPWGNEFGLERANTPLRWQALGEEGDTTPVGAFPAGVSPYGVYDMSGNVWEWTASWYLPYPGNGHASENYGETNKVLKGGSWWDCSFYQCGISAPSYNRAFFLPSTRNKSFGFRCAKNAD